MMIDMTDDPPRRNTDLTAANATRMRAAEERKAADLRDRGWTCIPPDDQEPWADLPDATSIVATNPLFQEPAQ